MKSPRMRKACQKRKAWGRGTVHLNSVVCKDHGSKNAYALTSELHASCKMLTNRKRGGQDSGVSTMLKKGKNAEKFEEKKPVRKQVAHHQAEGDNQTLTDSANGRKGFERMGATDAQNEARSERKNPAQKTWISSQVPRKKRKRRSRQKNLRRDKRPPHEKPSYLTEETLRGSRLQPQQMSVENGQRDVEQV